MIRSPSTAPSDRRVLLTVSGVITDDLDEQIAAGRRPRADYRVLQDHLDADVIDAALAAAQHRRLGRLLRRFAGVGPLLAWACFRRRSRYEVIVTDGEQVGLPLALLCRLFGRSDSRHAMIVHVISPRKKASFVRVARLAPLIDRWIVYCTAQADFIADRFAVPAERIITTPFMVDARFFTPDEANSGAMGGVEAAGGRSSLPMICAVGLERRDYPTLMEAVDGLDVEVVIAAASPWSKQANSAEGADLPTNVSVAKFSQLELRDVYRRAAFSVMPLVEVNFQAGITAILESMAMERPVVCTRTTGQTDTIIGIDGRGHPARPPTGKYVPPGDAPALRGAIEELLADPDTAIDLGRAARRWVVEHADVDVYAAGLAAVVDDLCRHAHGSPSSFTT